MVWIEWALSVLLDSNIKVFFFLEDSKIKVNDFFYKEN